MADAGSAHRRVIDVLWRGEDPFAGFPRSLYIHDPSGWNSNHEYLGQEVAKIRPDITVEVGVWKGGSTLTLARHLQSTKTDGVVIAVDTWLGSSEYWLDGTRSTDLSPSYGYPQLYYKFLNNVIVAGLQDYVVPLSPDSANAAIVVAKLDLRPSLVHIDAAHDYEGVIADLTRWWHVLRPGGVMICDDYDITLKVWGTVGMAVNDFLARNRHTDFAAIPYKCRFTKPA